MAYLLHIESSSTVCSVALSNDRTLIDLKELNDGYTHAENLHVFIHDILQQNNINVKQLEAVSVSSGPGSYTGLRIGFSAAKGLAYALQIPLITIDTLQALTSLAIEQINTDALYCPMLDARRMEVYCAGYNKDLTEEIKANALVLTNESIGIFKSSKPIYFFGDGMPKAKELLQSIPQSHFIENIVPGAKALINLAYQKFSTKDFANTAYSEPFYLKEFFFHTAQK